MNSSRRLASFALLPLALAACAVAPVEEAASTRPSPASPASLAPGAAEPAQVAKTVTSDTAEERARRAAQVIGIIGLPPAVTVQGTLGRVTIAKAKSKPNGVHFMVRTIDRKTQEVALDEQLVSGAGGIAAVTGHAVSVTGYVVGDVLTATSLTVQPNALPLASFTGARKWVTIPCRFSDLPLPAREQRDYFQALMGSTNPGLGDYWAQASWGALTLDGSAVLDWIDMPLPASAYQQAAPADRIAEMMTDCLVTADPLVDFSQFDGITLAFSHNLDTQLVGGPFPLDFDGPTKMFALGVMSPVEFRDQSQAARVMGMGMDLTFSGSAPLKFDSEWDVMSGGGICHPISASMGCIGAYPAAEQGVHVGWLSGSQVASVPLGRNAVVSLDYVGTWVETGHAGVLHVPIDENTYYTVEARSSATGYDVNVPRTGVLVHKMSVKPVPDDGASDQDLLDDTTRLRLVDMNHDGDLNDVGSELAAGGSFTDESSGVQIQISPPRWYGFDVTVTRAQTLTLSVTDKGIHVTGGGIDCGMGHKTCSASAPYGGTVHLAYTLATNYDLTTFTGCTFSGGTCNVVMDQARSVAMDATYERPNPCCGSGASGTCAAACRLPP